MRDRSEIPLQVGDRVLHKSRRVSERPGTVLEVRKLVAVEWDWQFGKGPGGWYRPDSLELLPSPKTGVRG